MALKSGLKKNQVVGGLKFYNGRYFWILEYLGESSSMFVERLIEILVSSGIANLEHGNTQESTGKVSKLKSITSKISKNFMKHAQNFVN